ncbi:MAG: hypothetical protein U9O83_01195 [Campylobacterota bacterium]|nr:hypothetical protein [Campylobacterota bacterium]
MNYRYGMKSRPFSLGTFPEPKVGFVVVEDRKMKCKYHDVLIYSYKLPKKVREDYELAYLGEAD